MRARRSRRVPARSGCRWGSSRPRPERSPRRPGSTTSRTRARRSSIRCTSRDEPEARLLEAQVRNALEPPQGVGAAGGKARGRAQAGALEIADRAATQALRSPLKRSRRGNPRFPRARIGVPRFELGTSPTRTERATRLRHTPSTHRLAPVRSRRPAARHRFVTVPGTVKEARARGNETQLWLLL